MQDVDHDVYVFGLPQLAAAKRKLADGGVIALFLGYGQYRVRTYVPECGRNRYHGDR